MTPRRWALRCFAGVISAFVLPMRIQSQARGQARGQLQQQTARRIFGSVLTRENKRIDGVLVTAYRRKVKIDDDTTKNGGMYSLDVGGVDPVDTVLYRHSSYIEGTVEHLCGSLDQNINKTLYLKGTPLDLFEGQEALSALERLFYLEEGADTFKTTVSVGLETLGGLQGRIPNRLNTRLAQVGALFKQAQA